jgi:hypothetical protein
LPIFANLFKYNKVMKSNNTVFWSFALLVAIASLYRVMPHGTYGFPPQLAMAVFAGAVIQNRKFSFLMPLGSMFLSDLLFQGLYALGYSNTPGFYEGQWINYLLITSLTVFGFWAKNLKPGNILGASVAAPTFYFFASNLVVWIGGGGLGRAKTFDGLMQCYADGLPFYYASLAATVVFSAVLFGVYRLFLAKKTQVAAA